MSKVFTFNHDLSGTYIDNISKSEGTNTNGSFARTEVGTAWYNDGTADVQMPTAITLSRNNTTIEVWFKASEIVANRFLLGYDLAGSKYLGLSATSLQFESNTNGDFWLQYAFSNLTANVWYHLLIIADGGTVTNYLDNVLIDTRTPSDDVTFEYIGNYSGKIRDWFGYIGKVEFHNRAITERERSDAYRDFLNSHPLLEQKYPRYGSWTKASQVNERGLTAAYSMVPSSGTLVDVSGSGWNGTIDNYTQSVEGLRYGGSGNANIDLGDITSLNSASQLTWNFRLKLQSLATDQVLFNKGNIPQASTWITFQILTSEFRFDINGTGSRGATSSVPVLDDKEFTLTVVFDGTQTGNANRLKVYFNGVQETLTFGANTVPATTSDLSTRNAYFSFNSGISPWLGDFIDTKIYNYAFTSQQAEDYHNQFARRVVLNTTPSKLDAVGNVPFGMIPGTGTYTTQELTTQDAVLPELDIGTKYLQCDVAGTISIPFNSAYGELEFYIYRASGATTPAVYFISSTKDISNHYSYRRNSGALRLHDASAIISANANSTMANATWHGIKMTRTLDNEFTIYLKGGVFGSVYQLMSTTGGTGTNPIVDSDYTTSEYIVLDLDANDRVIIKNWKAGVEQ